MLTNNDAENYRECMRLAKHELKMFWLFYRAEEFKAAKRSIDAHDHYIAKAIGFASR